MDSGPGPRNTICFKAWELESKVSRLLGKLRKLPRCPHQSSDGQRRMEKRGMNHMAQTSRKGLGGNMRHQPYSARVMTSHDGIVNSTAVCGSEPMHIGAIPRQRRRLGQVSKLSQCTCGPSWHHARVVCSLPLEDQSYRWALLKASSRASTLKP